MAAPAVTAPTSSGGPTAAMPLDDVMLAMDVVDNLRHAEKLVERELGAEDRDRELKERLRKLYAAQGIDVPEHILDEGVAALHEDRFAYQPLAPGLSRSLALAWVRRGRWLKGLALAIGILAVAAGGWYFAVKLPAEQQLAEQARAAVDGDAIAGRVLRIGRPRRQLLDRGDVAECDHAVTEAGANDGVAATQQCIDKRPQPAIVNDHRQRILRSRRFHKSSP